MRVLLVIMFLLSSVCAYAQLDDKSSFTSQQIETLKLIADGVNIEKIPAEVAKLRTQRNDLINQMNDEIKSEQVSSATRQQGIRETYQSQISAVESQIQSKEAELAK